MLTSARTRSHSRDTELAHGIVLLEAAPVDATTGQRDLRRSNAELRLNLHNSAPSTHGLVPRSMSAEAQIASGAHCRR